jgi:hypothetical protein
MAGTAYYDIAHVTPSAGAKAAGYANYGADYAGLFQLATMKANELKVIMAQISTMTPGGDTNAAAIASIIAEIV